MKIFFLTLLGFFGLMLHAQDLQNANWPLAEFGGLHFTPTTRTPMGSAMTIDNLAGAAVSDQEGNLLFYTDGLTVWDAANNVISNGVRLLGFGGDFSQNVVIVPNPLDINRYYIVSISVAPNIWPSEPFHGLRFSEVDMTNGIGEVITATVNTPLVEEDGVTPIDDDYPVNFGKITTARHGNGLDYWIIAEIGHDIYSYLVDDTGIHPPVVSASPLPTALYLDETNSPSSANGPMKISPDNQRILIGYSGVNRIAPTSALYVGSFDENTGLVSDFGELLPESTDQLVELVGAEFSPNSGVVHRLHQSFVISSELTTLIGGVWGQDNYVLTDDVEDARIAQRAIDGKIYFEDTDSFMPPANGTYIGLIDTPNVAAYGISYNSVDVGSASVQNNIPPWVQWQPCQRFLTTANAFSGLEEREREIWIRSSDVFTGTTARGVYHAGEFVELLPGFETVINAQFSAYIEGCSGDFPFRNGQTKPLVTETKAPVKTFASPAKLLVYPNPASTEIKVRFDRKPLRFVRIFGMDGKMVLEQNAQGNEVLIMVNALAKGMYIIKAEQENSRILTSKFIKN